MAVSDALSRSFLELNVQTDVANGKLMAFIAARGEILSKQFSETEVSIHCRLPLKFAGQIDRTQATVSEVSGGDQRLPHMTEEA